MLIPSIDDKEVGGLNGEVADLADMSRIGVGSGLPVRAGLPVGPIVHNRIEERAVGK